MSQWRRYTKAFITK